MQFKHKKGTTGASKPNVLTIAGSDCSGGAGIQADLKVFSALGVYGMSVITALTAQNTTGVKSIQCVTPDFIRAQLTAVVDDIGIHAVKIGMLYKVEAIACLADILGQAKLPNVVLDPVMEASSGTPLLATSAETALRELLIPLVDVLMPNLAEASRLLDCPIPCNLKQMRQAAEDLYNLGPRVVYLKGGHLPGDSCVDVIFDGDAALELAEPRINLGPTHGTGCSLSSAVAAFLARGFSAEQSFRQAKRYVFCAIQASSALSVGRGRRPLDHAFGLDIASREDSR